MKLSLTFAIPGDIDTPTGGYIYEKQLLLALRGLGFDVAHLALPDGFPDPSPDTVSKTADALAGLSPREPVILDGFLPGAMPPDALARMQAPFVAVTHHPLCYETGLDPARARYLRAVEGTNLQRAAHVIVPSPHTAERLSSDFGVGPAQITVAPPGITRPSRSAVARQGKSEILCVAQLVPRKGHKTLIKALARLKDQPWRATFVGRATDAAYAQALRELVAFHGLQDRIVFAGHVAPDELTAFYSRATLFALATEYEGYGMVFAEAMAHHLPIVTCDGGAVSETVPRDAGAIVPVGDAQDFAAAVRHLLSDSTARGQMAKAAAWSAEALPRWEDTARIVGDVLMRVAPQS